MNWKAQQLLYSAAKLYQREKESFSRVEIVQKLNEIKYLAAQKKVPRLTLRKEMIHLETQLQSLFELEKKLALQKKKEALHAANYKKQIGQLKKRLQAADDKKLQRKVEKLSHLLGDYLAKYGTEKEVEELKQYLGKPFARILPQVSLPVIPRKELLASKIGELKERLQQGDIAAELRQNLQLKLDQLEQRLRGEEPGEVKHTLLFEGPKQAATDELRLPTPPPLRRT